MERSWFWRGGLAVVAFAVLALGAACGDDDGDDDDGGSGGGFATDASGGDDDRAVGVPNAGDVSGEEPGNAPPSSQLLDRKIIFTAGITLSVEDVGAAFSEVSRLATSVGGFVEGSSFSNADDDDDRSATLTLRVPAENYQQTLADLRGIDGATVRTENSKSSEVTEEYTDLQSRLRNLERTEQQYLTLLERATTIPDILTVQDRIDGVRLQIEQIQGRLQALDDLTDLATIDVSLVPVPVAKVGSGDGPKPVGEAFADAFSWFTEASRYVMSGVAVLTVAAMFLAVPAGLGLAAALIVRRLRPTAV